MSEILAASEDRPAVRFPIKNSAYAFVRLGANHLLPLLVLPHLARVLGAEAFGTLMLAQAINLYFIIVVEYGFQLTGAKAVAAVRNKNKKIALLLIEVGTARLLLALLSTAAFAACAAAKLISSELLLLLLAFGWSAVIGAALQPAWLFQGLEEFRLVTLVQVCSRVVLLAPILFFVQSADQVIIAQLMMSAPWLLSAVVLAFAAHFRFGRINQPQNLQNVGVHLKQGFNVFLSQISTTMFTSTNTVLVGGLLGATYAGYYALAEKVIRAVAQLTVPVCEAVYPRIAGCIATNREGALSLARRVLLLGTPLVAIPVVLIMVGADALSTLLTPEGTAEVKLALQIMAVIPLTIFANNICGTQILLTLGESRAFRNAVLLSGAAVTSSCAVLIFLIGFAGAPVAVVVGELLILYLMYKGSIRAVGYDWTNGPVVNTGKA